MLKRSRTGTRDQQQRIARTCMPPRMTSGNLSWCGMILLRSSRIWTTPHSPDSQSHSRAPAIMQRATRVKYKDCEKQRLQQPSTLPCGRRRGRGQPLVLLQQRFPQRHLPQTAKPPPPPSPPSRTHIIDGDYVSQMNIRLERCHNAQ